MIYAAFGLLGLLTWAAIFRRWRHGVFMLIAFLPFSGAMILWTRGAGYTLLAKDFLFVIPLYLSFALHGTGLRTVRLPAFIALPITILAAIVLAQMANPKVAGLAVALVGAKVWLFYIPLMVVAAAMLRSERDVTMLLRAMVVLIPVPCVVGLVQYFGSSSFGHEATITAFYGTEAAAAATQGFQSFDYGGALYRLPSTFVSVSHYFGYVEHSLVPAYAVLRCDPSRGWRGYGVFCLLLLLTAGFLSGARSAFFFLPLLMVLTMVLDRVIVGAMVWVTMVPALFIAVLNVAGLDPFLVFDQVQLLAEHNAKGLAIGSIKEAIQRYPFGVGTGMNTIGARHVVGPDRRIFGFESQYGKTVVELGVVGLLALLAVFGAIIAAAWRMRTAAAQSSWASAGAAFTAYFIVMPLHALKGWPLDWEPANIYYWMFAAVTVALPQILAPRPRSGVLVLREIWQRERALRRRDQLETPRMRPARPEGG